MGCGSCRPCGGAAAGEGSSNRPAAGQVLRSRGQRRGRPVTGQTSYPERTPSGGRIGEGVRMCPLRARCKDRVCAPDAFSPASSHRKTTNGRNGNGADPPMSRVRPVRSASVMQCRVSAPVGSPLTGKSGRDQLDIVVCAEATARSGVDLQDVADVPRHLRQSRKARRHRRAFRSGGDGPDQVGCGPGKG